jgi:hypothetical protein
LAAERRLELQQLVFDDFLRSVLVRDTLLEANYFRFEFLIFGGKVLQLIAKLLRFVQR